MTIIKIYTINNIEMNFIVKCYKRTVKDAY